MLQHKAPNYSAMSPILTECPLSWQDFGKIVKIGGIWAYNRAFYLDKIFQKFWNIRVKIGGMVL